MDAVVKTILWRTHTKWRVREIYTPSSWMICNIHGPFSNCNTKEENDLAQGSWQRRVTSSKSESSSAPRKPSGNPWGETGNELCWHLGACKTWRKVDRAKENHVDHQRQGKMQREVTNEEDEATCLMEEMRKNVETTQHKSIANALRECVDNYEGRARTLVTKMLVNQSKENLNLDTDLDYIQSTPQRGEWAAAKKRSAGCGSNLRVMISEHGQPWIWAQDGRQNMVVFWFDVAVHGPFKRRQPCASSCWMAVAGNGSEPFLKDSPHSTMGAPRNRTHPANVSGVTLTGWTWRSHDSVFTNPTTSSSAPYQQKSNPWISDVSERTSPHVMSEIRVRTVSQKFSRPQWGRIFKEFWGRPTTTADFGTSFQQIPFTSNVRLLEDKIQDWGMYLFTILLWIKEVEIVESVDDLKSSSSVRGIQMPDIEVLDAKIAFSAEPNHPEHLLQEKGQSGGIKKLKKRTVSFVEDRSLTWSTPKSLEPTILSRIMRTCLQLFFDMTILKNSIRNGTEFCYRWQRFHLMTSWKDCTN